MKSIFRDLLSWALAKFRSFVDKKRLLTYFLAVAIGILAVYPPAPRVTIALWAIGLNFGGLWIFSQRSNAPGLWWPCVIYASLLPAAGCLILANAGFSLVRWLGVLWFGYIAYEGVKKIPNSRGERRWELLLGTTGAGVLALYALIGLFG